MTGDEITYIWNQKPNIISEGYYYNASEIDAWLEKLKVLYEALVKTVIEQDKIISEFKEHNEDV